MQPITINMKIKRRDYVASGMYLTIRSWITWASVVLGSAIIAAGLFYLIKVDDSGNFIWQCCMILGVTIMLFHFYAPLHNIHKVFSAKNNCCDIKFTLEQQVLTVESKAAVHTLKWTNLVKLLDTSEYMFLFFKPGGVFTVYKNYMENKEIDAIRHFLEKKSEKRFDASPSQ